VAPQVAGYLTLPAALLNAGLQDIGSLHRRLGEIRDEGMRAEWEGFARVYGSSFEYRTDRGFGDFGFDAKQNYGALQVGGSRIVRRDNEGVWRLGGALGLGRSSLTPDAPFDGPSETGTDTRNLAAIATYQSLNGWYADIVLSAGSFSAKTTSQAWGGAEVARFHGSQFAASVEVGHPFPIASTGWEIEPQLQYAWQTVRFDDFRDGDGIENRLGTRNLGVLRVGARLAMPITNADGTRLRPYIKLNYLQGDSALGTIDVGGGTFRLGDFGNAWQVGGGVSGMINKRLSVYGDIAWQRQSGGVGWSNWLFSGGLRYTFGGS
jgi:outer membrane autotransporter protein